MYSILGPFLDIALAAGAITLALQVLQRKVVDKRLLKRNQEAMKEKQKKLQELIKANASKKDIEKMETEMMEAAQASMQGMTKTMMYSLAVSLPVFLFMGWNFSTAVIALPFPVPFWNAFDVMKPGTWFAFKLFTETSWLGWYALISLGAGIVLNIVFGQMDKAQEKK